MNFEVLCSWRLSAYSVNTCTIIRLCRLLYTCSVWNQCFHLGRFVFLQHPGKKKKKNLCIKLGTISWRYACYLRRALLYVLEAQAFTLLWRNALILPWIHLLTKTLFFFFQSHCSNNNATCISEVVFFIIWIEKQLPLNITSI